MDMRKPVPRLGALLLLLATQSVSAAVVDNFSNPYDILRLDNKPDVFLDTQVSLFAGVASLRYQMRYQVVDMILDVKWRDQQGSLLLHAGNGFGFRNVAYSLDRDWVGVFFPTLTHVLVDGTADFSGTIGNTQNPCVSGRVCLAKYFDWSANVPSLQMPAAGTLTASDERSAARPDSFAGRASSLPTGLTETRSTLSAQEFLGAFEPMLKVSSRADAVGQAWRYTYRAENLSTEDYAVDFGVTGVAGTVQAGQTLDVVVMSSFAPTLLGTSINLRNGDGAVAGMAFDAISPVPEPPAVAFLLIGLGCLAGSSLRRAAKRHASSPQSTHAVAWETFWEHA